MASSTPAERLANEAASEGSEVIIQKEVKQTWVSYLWDTFDKSPEERRLLFKLDTAILTFASLDQVNVSNAFVSGMKEDLGLYENQLNYMQTCWTIGYVIGEIPSNIFLTRVRPRYWIPAMEVIWSVLTFSLSRCNTAAQFYILRFFIAVAGFFVLPDVPEIANPWYLSKTVRFYSQLSDKGLVLNDWLYQGGRPRSETHGVRRQKASRAVHRGKTQEDLFLVAYLSPDAVICVCTCGKRTCFNNGAAGSQPVFQQYLKDSTNPKYSVGQINTYPTLTSVVQIVTTLAYAWLSDTVLGGRRWPPLVFGGVMNIICYVSLAVWDIPVGWKWTCFILAGAGYGLSGLIMAWSHEICADDNEERAITVGSMNEIAYVFQAWLPLIVWQQIDAPQYRKGYITVTCLSVLLIITAFVVRYLDNREKAQKYRLQQAQEEGDTEALTNTPSLEVTPVNAETNKS
ncbi:hypothetical protein T310_3021 [Rasamsonia emersonii CBS 393.64]|uniref:Pantothenate transporter n=1 Tax=Rasamsonia emersonii (strain ATCC 16479 / CBS 393.64 / IMI 116815) TaxID=1408163 RepID=A0A0F4YXK4_RASE3|nr:hypothetical protein T310_3021 [Rasamsonia emersonii CBS 393.64]KKA22969.1 hypothetical protein T310_3021 [Rasamsonia emersonii CBS 393.64]